MIQRSSSPDERAHVAAAAFDVEHQVGDPLSRTVIGEAPAAPRPMHGEATRIEQLAFAGRGAGGVDGRVLEQPDELGFEPRSDLLRACLHGAHGGRVVDRARARGPLDHGGDIAGRDAGRNLAGLHGANVSAPRRPRLEPAPVFAATANPGSMCLFRVAEFDI